MNTYTKELEVAVNIAREAGVIMLKYFNEDQKVEIKEDHSQVTIADKLINSMVIERLSTLFPEDGVIGEEESTSEYGMGRKWFCDPIDGTAAYIWGVPTAMFSLGLVVDGKPVMGVAFDPFLNLMYTGIKGEKSLCNGKIISVSNTDLVAGIVGVTGSAKSLPDTPYFKKLKENKVRIASFSGFVYKCCLVAKGRLVGYIEHGGNAHDIAAAQVIVEGAGGRVSSPEGKELDYSKPLKGGLISNGVVHEQLLEYCRI